MSLTAPVQRANHGSHFRAYGLRGLANLIDPFLGIDHAWMSAPTFPPHPHAGLSALSYVFLDAETGLRNRDSLGNENVIRPGGLHWLAAGSRVVHEEVPAEQGKTVHALQIFLSLQPETHAGKSFAQSLEPQDVPVVQIPGAKVRVVLGEFAGQQCPLAAPFNVTMLDITLERHSTLTLPIAAGDCAFLMPVFGATVIDGERYHLDDLQLPVYPSDPNQRQIELQALDGGAKVMLFSGRPLQPQL